MTQTKHKIYRSFLSIAVTLAFLFVFDVSLSNAQNRKCRVYIFAGQSNCNGAGGIDEFNANSSDVLSPYAFKLFRAFDQTRTDPRRDPRNQSNWAQVSGDTPTTMLEPFVLRSDHSGFIGPESQFARRMRNVHGSTDDVAIIKVSAGSTSMLEWEPPRSQWISPSGSLTQFQRRIRLSPLLFFQHLKPTVDANLESLEQTYGADNVEVAGFVWIQGESDLKNFGATPNLPNRRELPDAHDNYRLPLQRMIAALRFWYNKEMPFTIVLTQGQRGVDFEIEGKPRYQRSVRAARLQSIQRAVADEDRLGLGRWVSTQWAFMNGNVDDPESDNFHWNTYSLQVIGLLIANEFNRIPGH